MLNERVKNAIQEVKNNPTRDNIEHLIMVAISTPGLSALSLVDILDAVYDGVVEPEPAEDVYENEGSILENVDPTDASSPANYFYWVGIMPSVDENGEENGVDIIAVITPKDSFDESSQIVSDDDVPYEILPDFLEKEPYKEMNNLRKVKDEYDLTTAKEAMKEHGFSFSSKFWTIVESISDGTYNPGDYEKPQHWTSSGGKDASLENKYGVKPLEDFDVEVIRNIEYQVDVNKYDTVSTGTIVVANMSPDETFSLSFQDGRMFMLSAEPHIDFEFLHELPEREWEDFDPTDVEYTYKNMGSYMVRSPKEPESEYLNYERTLKNKSEEEARDEIRKLMVSSHRVQYWVHYSFPLDDKDEAEECAEIHMWMKDPEKWDVNFVNNGYITTINGNMLDINDINETVKEVEEDGERILAEVVLNPKELEAQVLFYILEKNNKVSISTNYGD